MPFGDMTGPEGKGPRTGRRAGYCSGYRIPGYLNRAIGRFGFLSKRNSSGRLRGRRHRR